MPLLIYVSVAAVVWLACLAHQRMDIIRLRRKVQAQEVLARMIELQKDFLMAAMKANAFGSQGNDALARRWNDEAYRIHLQIVGE